MIRISLEGNGSVSGRKWELSPLVLMAISLTLPVTPSKDLLLSTAYGPPKRWEKGNPFERFVWARRSNWESKSWPTGYFLEVRS